MPDGPGNRPDEGGREIVLRDEVLELLFWLEGEGFTEHSTLAGMLRFLSFPPGDVAATIAQLIERGELVAQADGQFQLTPAGRREAARRFADDFAPLLHQGHGECNDPDCECHEDPHGTSHCRATEET